jgi:probable phosphoglycerate mutase
MATRIFLLRHGETPWSLSGQHTGRTDLPLTANGERRASRLSGILQGIPFSHVLTSPLQRARQTCALAGFGAVARVEPDLHEWDYGDYEGRTTAEIHGQSPDWNIFQDGCPHGESLDQIARRADRVLAGLLPLQGTVALFSHGHFLRVLAVRWVGLPVQQGLHFALDTGSISILGHEHAGGKIPAISLWNASAVPSESGSAH